MKTFIDIVKEIGFFGAIGIVLIGYVTIGGTEISLDSILKLSLPTADNAINRVILLLAVVLVVGQFIHSAQRARYQAERDEEHRKRDKEHVDWKQEKSVSDLNRIIEDQKRDLEKSKDELTDIRKQLTEDQALVARRNQEWHQLLEIVKSHAALSNEDDPRFVSRVVKSADRLRDEVAGYINTDKLLAVSRKMASFIRCATMTFIGSVEDIEFRSKKNLHDADFRIDELLTEDAKQLRGAHHKWRESIQTLLRGISYGRGDTNFLPF